MVSETRRGIVALGDSITRGHGGTPVLGIHFQSWAQWLAEALELPFTNLAADGALADGVRTVQVPRLNGPYDLGLLYVGVNDTRSPGWDTATFEREAGAIVSALAGAADRVLVLTVPEDLGRPPAAPRPAQANRILRGLAPETVELAGFGGRRLVLPDAVHPTSAGQLAIADTVARALGVRRLPSSLAEPAGGRLPAARYEAWWARMWLRDRVRRVREARS